MSFRYLTRCKWATSLFIYPPPTCWWTLFCNYSSLPAPTTQLARNLLVCFPSHGDLCEHRPRYLSSGGSPICIYPYQAARRSGRGRPCPCINLTWTLVYCFNFTFLWITGLCVEVGGLIPPWLIVYHIVCLFSYQWSISGAVFKSLFNTLWMCRRSINLFAWGDGRKQSSFCMSCREVLKICMTM